MDRERVSLDHPLWSRLSDLDEEAAQRFPTNLDKGFGSLGLILLAQPEHFGYHCTPVNSLAFAHTGGEGVHFSFVVREGKVSESSPIVITIPGAYEQPNVIGGESLFDFLCLGYHRGYFALEALPSDNCLDAFGSAEWQPKEDRDYAVGYAVNEQERQLLDFLIKQLGLLPWSDIRGKFQRLQERYMPLLEIPTDG